MSSSIEVAGTCRSLGTADASVIHSIACEATDANGSRYALRFVGDGQRVRVTN
jgi:hypothetical protein